MCHQQFKITSPLETFDNELHRIKDARARGRGASETGFALHVLPPRARARARAARGPARGTTMRASVRP
eukprot:COSAG02_NODE_1691_length_11296_cov_7.891757_9_plen_69_part_00